MKFSGLILIAALAGTLSVLGCGDDDTTNTTTGNGNTGGGDSCNTGMCADNSTLRAACEAAVELCAVSPVENCAELAIADICESS